jgi:PPM family protein phosphatase
MSSQGPDADHPASKTPAETSLPAPADLRPSAGEITVAARGLTDQGRVRRNNEDSLAACDLSARESFTGSFGFSRRLGPRGMLFVVADGMGGQACGELASRMCCELLPARLLEDLGQLETVRPVEFGGLLARALEAANQSILEAARAEPACHGMGTTVTAAAILGPSLVVAQVGDSRAYLVREQRLFQLTRDQTLLNYLIEIGAVDQEYGAGDPRRSILLQALGTADRLKVALTTVGVCRGDQLLVMSDGLYSMVPPEEMTGITASSDDLETRCRRLVEAANSHGGADNVTVILAGLTGDGLAAPDPARTPSIEPLSTPPETS